MGGFINNVHVFAPDGVDAALPDVLDVLRGSAQSDGYVEVANAHDADRSAAVIFAPGDRWIAIIDEALDSMDERESDRLAERISATGRSAITTLVADGEELELRLFENGKRVDRYHGAFRGAKRKGKPARWAQFLEAGQTTEDLDEVWKVAGLGEELLANCSKLFGWRGDAAFASYRDVGGIEPDARVTKVFFRSKESPIWKQTIEGPPRLSYLRLSSGPEHVIHLAEGEGHEDELHFHFSSTGGRSTGLEVLVGCETAGIIEPVSARVRRWLTNEEGSTAAFGRNWKSKWQSWRARLPEIPIAGALPPLAAAASGPTIIKYGEEMNRRSFELTIRVRVLAKNAKSRIVVVVEPIANREAGASEAVPALIVGPLRRPLTLESGTHLIAHAFFRDRSEASARTAIEALERWHVATGIPEYAYWIQKRVKKKITNEFVVVADAKKSELWPSPDDVFACNHIDFSQFVRGRNEDPRDAVSGFARDQAVSEFGVENSPSNFQGARGEHAVSQLFLVHSLEDATDERLAELESIAASLFDQFTERDLLLQAYIARWSKFSTSVTAYEDAQGIQSEPVGGHAWTSRYLRGLGGHVWLGRELRKAAGVMQTRFDVDDNSIDDVERTLSEILPRAT